MLNFISQILRNIADDLDTGTSKLSSQDTTRVVSLLGLIYNGDTELSKTEAYQYLGISRATFDNLVQSGQLPKGQSTHEGVKSLFWYKSDLEIYELTHAKD